MRKPKPSKRERPERRRPAAAAMPDQKPLWLFLTEPGLASLLLKELKFRDVVPTKAKPLVLYLRNYDLLVLPDDQVLDRKAKPRLCLHILTCPVFGKAKISDRQLDRLADHWKRDGRDGLVASIAGSLFDRRELSRWVSARLGERGVRTKGDPVRPVWLIAVDEKYYFGFPRYNHHQIANREKGEDRRGSLPDVFAAALVFAAKPSAGEVVWDPFVGTGTVLREAAQQATGGTFIGSDADEAALRLARENCRGIGGVELVRGDSTALNLKRSDISLVVTNPPFGKQFEATQGTEQLYGAVLRNALRHAAPSWRAALITSDTAALRNAAGSIGGLIVQEVTKARVRGQDASIFLITRSG